MRRTCRFIRWSDKIPTGIATLHPRKNWKSEIQIEIGNPNPNQSWSCRYCALCVSRWSRRTRQLDFVVKVTTWLQVIVLTRPTERRKLWMPLSPQPWEKQKSFQLSMMLSCSLIFLYLFICVPSICGFQVTDSKLRVQRRNNVRGLTNSPLTQASFNNYSFRRKHTSLGLMGTQGQYTSFWGIFVTGLQFAGPIFFLSLQFSSVMTAVEITKTKTCGLLSPLPFISLFTNSFVWSLYGLLKMDGTVFIPNSCGVLASLYCILAFHKHTIIKPNKLYIAALVTSSLALCLATAGKCPLIGVLGCFLSVLLSGSPLAVMKTVVQEKSTTALPFTTSFVIWLNSISWLLYGVLVAHDILIYGPNILGFLLASVQMSLFAIYGIKPAVKSAEVVSKIWPVLTRSVHIDILLFISVIKRAVFE